MKDFTIDGFVTQNVETKATQSGRMVTKFSVNSPDYDRKTQERTPQYFDVEFWHDQGDPKAAMIQEGALLLVWGQLHQDKWTDRATGQNRSKVVLRARELAQIRAPQPGRQQARPQQPAAYAPQGYPQPAAQQYAPQPAPTPQGYPQPAPQQYAPQPAAYAPAPQAAPQAAPQPAPAQAPVVEIYDEDIPF